MSAFIPCPYCGEQISQDSSFCTHCGAKLSEQQSNTAQQNTSAPRYNAPPVMYAAVPQEITEDQLPYRLKPLSPWTYWGLNILFMIPIIGFICLVIFALSDDNINRRNYARSFFCTLLISVIIIIVLAVTGLLGSIALRSR